MLTKKVKQLIVNIANEELKLLSERALILIKDEILLVSDLHFGKIDHFRKNGIALPLDAARQDIRKLKVLIEKEEPKKVIFLGDLFHSDYNYAWQDFKVMISEFSNIEFILVLGNHDILNHAEYDSLTLVHQLSIRNIVLTHEPMDILVKGKYNLCGHIHPGVRLRGKAKQSLRMPCFYFGKEMGIMPAFGTFTGTHVIKPMVGDQIFVIDKDIVIQVS